MSYNLKSYDIIALWIGFISIAMVSNLPTFSGKVFQIPKSFVDTFVNNSSNLE